MTGQKSAADRLRGELGAIQEELARLASRVRAIRQRTEQLTRLRDEERQVAARIAELERLLDFDRVAAHARGALADAPLAADPVPHLVATEVLPPPVYQALLEAIPAAVFFEGSAGQQQELRVPPRLAPTSSIVTWAFLSDLVLSWLGPFLVQRFSHELAVWARKRFPSLPPFDDWDVDITLTEGRIVRRTPGCSSAGPAAREWDLMTCVLHLARAQDTEEHGSTLSGIPIPFRPNVLMAYVGAAGEHVYTSIPSDAPATLERHTYEFGIGPTRDARRTLTALMAKTT